MHASRIALIFASTYANQKYSTAVGAESRSAIIYAPCLFCGEVGEGEGEGMQTVLPVAFSPTTRHLELA
jgi:hypothetical protein